MKKVIAIVGIVMVAALVVVIARGCKKDEASHQLEPLHVVSWGGQFQSDLMASWIQPAAANAGSAT